jgi:VWFA-related protein
LISLLAPCTFKAQTTSPQETSTKAQTANPQEISSREVEPTFKLQSERNLVMVRVVVRDSKGATVNNLRKEDFQLFDHGKLQNILHFSLEKPAPKAPPAASPKPAEKAAEPEPEEETAAATPRRFVALYFDDVNTTFGNLVPARDAADHFLATSLRPGDRVALFTSSGQKQLDFTADIAQIHKALFDLLPRPIIGHDSACDAIPPYEAWLIVDHNDPTALAVAGVRSLNCNTCPADNAAEMAQCIQRAEATAQSMAPGYVAQAEIEASAVLRGVEAVIRRLATMPGQRSMVIVSAGFMSETLQFELGQLADRALRVNVILNALDARGLYTDPQVADVNPTLASILGRQQLTSVPILTAPRSLAVASARHQTDGIEALARDTGGLFFHNNNDMGEGFRELTAAPEAFYVLAFSPQNLKTDGAFHPLQVKLVSGKGLTVQARKGYYAPRKPNDPAVQEKEEIREAVFSQDETNELPIDVHTQFFMKSESEARITVLTRIDLRPLHFRKEGDRNVDDLTFVAALFDRDGHVVSGEQKAVELHLRDNSLDRYLQTGITMRSAFDVKPGTYLVRAVVRDSASGQISGLNRTVEIPY